MDKLQLDVSTTVIKQKEQGQLKRKTSKKISKASVLEVDLHIHQLVDSNKGMSNYDMLSLQLETVKKKIVYARQKHIPKLVFIHGVGSGVLRQELHSLLKGYSNLVYYDASLANYGRGATEVHIYQKSQNVY